MSQGPAKTSKITLFTSKEKLDTQKVTYDLGEIMKDLNTCYLEVFQTKEPNWYVLYCHVPSKQATEVGKSLKQFVEGLPAQERSFLTNKTQQMLVEGNSTTPGKVKVEIS